MPIASDQVSQTDSDQWADPCQQDRCSQGFGEVQYRTPLGSIVPSAVGSYLPLADQWQVEGPADLSEMPKPLGSFRFPIWLGCLQRLIHQWFSPRRVLSVEPRNQDHQSNHAGEHP